MAEADGCSTSSATKQQKKRFASVADDDYDKILKEKDPLNTHRATDSSVKMFREYLKEKNLSEDFENMPPSELDKMLGKFYVEARNKNGELYKKSSLTAFRHGINRHLKDIDIVNNPDFTRSKDAFVAMNTELKRQGLGGISHHPPIEKSDLEKLYASFDISNAQSLQQKVFVDILLYFGRRGRENLRDLCASDFSCRRDDDGVMYIYLDKDELTKNHRNDTNTADGRMYQIPGADEKCPVKTFVKYKRMLPPGCNYLFPKCRKLPYKSGYYFDNCPMGHNKLGAMMKTLSEKAGLSQKYTNHSLRATSVHLLDSAQIPTRHIMTVTGHKAESSLKTYTGYTNAQCKRNMSNTISQGLGLATDSKNVGIADSYVETDSADNFAPAGDNTVPVSANLDLDGVFGENAELKQLSNSQMDNLLSEFENDDFDDILKNIPDVAATSQSKTFEYSSNSAASSNNTSFSQSKKCVEYSFNNSSAMQLPFPVIKSQTCNVVINYNFNQK